MCKIIFPLIQIDDEGTEVSDTIEVFLSVRGQPAPDMARSGLSGGIIAAIIAAACFILLIAILIFVAFRY